MGVTYIGRINTTFVLVSIVWENEANSCLQQRQTLLCTFIVFMGICEQGHKTWQADLEETVVW